MGRATDRPVRSLFELGTASATMAVVGAVVLVAGLTACTSSPPAEVAAEPSAVTAVPAGPDCGSSSPARVLIPGLVELAGVSTAGELAVLVTRPDALTVGQDVKLIWRVTGAGPLQLSATAPGGSDMQPLVWGPTPHPTSTWQRPGDEWGTGYRFTSAGCWRLAATRDGASGYVTLTVRA